MDPKASRGVAKLPGGCHPGLRPSREGSGKETEPGLLVLMGTGTISPGATAKGGGPDRAPGNSHLGDTIGPQGTSREWGVTREREKGVSIEQATIKGTKDITSPSNRYLECGHPHTPV